MPDSTWIHSGTPETHGKMDVSLAWIKDHRDTVIGASVMGCAAIIFGIWIAMHYTALREAAWKSLFIAQQTAYSGNYAEAAKQLDSIEVNYSRTSAWGFAVLSQGDILFRQEKFKEAADEYSKVALKGPKNLMPFAVYNIGKSKEAAGDFPGAQAQYKDFLAAYPEHFLAPEVYYSLANAYELANNQAEAKAALEKIQLLYPETSWAMQAKAKLMPPQPQQKAEKPAAVKAPPAEVKK